MSGGKERERNEWRASIISLVLSTELDESESKYVDMTYSIITNYNFRFMSLYCLKSRLSY